MTAVADGRGLPALRDWQAQRSRRLALPATEPGAAAMSISLMARPIPDENRLPRARRTTAEKLAASIDRLALLAEQL